MTKKLDHIGIAVRNMDDTLDIYKRAYGLEPLAIETYEEMKTKIAFIPMGETQIHLLAATEPGMGPIGEFLEQNGEGFHHMGWRVEDIEGTMEELTQENILLRDKEPVKVGDSLRIAFVAPESTQNVLIELLEMSD